VGAGFVDVGVEIVKLQEGFHRVAEVGGEVVLIYMVGEFPRWEVRLWVFHGAKLIGNVLDGIGEVNNGIVDVTIC
jgi:hypothetical protein